jgi:hypothetical protein
VLRYLASLRAGAEAIVHAVALAARFLSDCFSSVETQIGSRYAIWESRAKAATIVYTVLVIGLLQRVSGRLGHGPAPCYKTAQAAALKAGCTVQRMAIPRKGQKHGLAAAQQSAQDCATAQRPLNGPL